jgi:phosphatidylserine/phosphatidylglycerophosphate/cardiolipin synthase-like enzyme
MHVKSVIVDDEWFVVGSINLFDRSMTKDLEAALLSSNPLANASLRAALTTIVEDSRPIDFKLFIYFARNELRVFFLRLLSRLRKSRTIFARTMRLPTEAPEQ